MRKMALWFVAVAILTLGGTSVAAGARSAVGTMYLWPVWPGNRLPMYFYPGACLLYGACAATPWEDRWEPRRPVAPSQPPLAEQDIWGTTGSPWGYVRRLPPPTPHSHLQPRFRDASTIRPEFDERNHSAPR